MVTQLASHWAASTAGSELLVVRKEQGSPANLLPIWVVVVFMVWGEMIRNYMGYKAGKVRN